MTCIALNTNYKININEVRFLSEVSSLSVTVLVLLTFIIGHVPQRRVTGVSLALTLVEASFNPTL